MKIYAKPIIGTNEITLSPPIDEIRNLVRKCFMKILEVNEEIPRVENIMFPEFKQNEAYLFAVSELEEPVMNIIDAGMASFETNIVGPENYLEMYKEYYYILNGKAEKLLFEFMRQDPPPFLKDFSRRIDGYDELKEELIMLRRSIPLNFLSLELLELNDTMYDIIDGLRSHIVNHFIRDNHDHNRR